MLLQVQIELGIGSAARTDMSDDERAFYKMNKINLD
jgi:hypothetical protein